MNASGTSENRAEPPVASQSPAVAGGASRGRLITLAPWAISFLLHAGVLALLVVMVWKTNPGHDGDSAQENIVPLANLSEFSPGMPGGPLSSPSVKALSTSPAGPLITPPPAARVTASQTASALGEGVRDLAMGANGLNLIGVGNPNAGASPNAQSAGTAAGLNPVGAHDLGDANPFAGSEGSGTSGGSAGAESAGPFTTSMYGLGGNARKLVYLVDASGSLIDSFPFVIQELKRSILALSDQQSFTVIFFQGDKAIEVPPHGLQWATAANKDAVINWIDPAKANVTPKSQSNPLRALRLGLQYHPDLMFLLSDDITGRGRYEVEQQRLLAEIDRANTHHTKINTIQFIYPDPLAAAHRKGTMELIAQRSGGLYKFLSGAELGIQ